MDNVGQLLSTQYLMSTNNFVIVGWECVEMISRMWLDVRPRWTALRKQCDRKTFLLYPSSEKAGGAVFTFINTRADDEMVLSTAGGIRE